MIVSLGIIHVLLSRAERGRALLEDASRQARSINKLRPTPFMLWFERSRELITHIIVFCVTSFVIFAVCMPYAILPPTGILSLPQDHVVDVKSGNILDKYPGINDIIHFLDPNRSLETRFLRDVRDQTRMNSDAYVFPYTLQYVTTKPYIYHIEQIFRWGLGPFIGILTIIGTLFLLLHLTDLTKNKESKIKEFASWILVFCIFVIFDYDGNIQRGAGSAGTDAPITVVAQGLSNAQYVKATGTIARSTANSISLVSSLERNYSNP
jgi:hypothetical protein